MISKLSSSDPDFNQQLSQLITWEAMYDKDIIKVVDDILAKVKTDGDSALVEFSNQFDATNADSINDLTIDQHQLKSAFEALDASHKSALQTAAERIKTYHQKQKLKSWSYEENGNMLGQKVTPIERVGIYVPGGKASYPSSVLMNAIPAKIAGVSQIIMTVPATKGEVKDAVLAAAYLAKVDKVFTVGGAQAIAALTYGTQTVPKVDKIVGPGNIYVAAAKRAVFGQVGIDMLAGPSEILIICDGKTDPDWIAMDLFSQAEHDENAQAILLCPDADFIKQVEDSMLRLLPEMPRKAIITTSIKNRGALILTKNLDDAINIANKIAPEHLELSTKNPENLLDKIKNAGAIFMGAYTSEALGDYVAGPNHVLPTSATSRFSSPLSVSDFQKKSSLIYISPEAASSLGKITKTLATFEDFPAHAQSAAYRIKK